MTINQPYLSHLCEFEKLTEPTLANFIERFSDTSEVDVAIGRLVAARDIEKLPGEQWQQVVGLSQAIQAKKQSLRQQHDTPSVADQLQAIQTLSWLRQARWVSQAEHHQDPWQYLTLIVVTGPISIEYQGRKYQIAQGAQLNLEADFPRRLQIAMIESNRIGYAHPYGSIGGVSFTDQAKQRLAELKGGGNVLGYLEFIYAYLTTYATDRLYLGQNQNLIQAWPSQPIAT